MIIRLHWSCALIIACTAATFSSAQTPEVIAVAGVTVIDTINGRAVPGQTVTIRNGTIVSVTAGDGQLQGAQRIDGRGKFLIPDSGICTRITR